MISHRGQFGLQGKVAGQSEREEGAAKATKPEHTYQIVILIIITHEIVVVVSHF